jgi:hypothetical protein
MSDFKFTGSFAGVYDRYLVTIAPRGRRLAETRPERHAQTDHRPEAVGAQLRRMPRHRRAPVVPGNYRLVGIAVDLLRHIGQPVAAHIGRERIEAGRRQRTQLMPPGIPAFGKAVAQHDPSARSAICMRMLLVSMMRFRHAAARAATVYCPIIVGDLLFTTASVDCGHSAQSAA